MSTIAIYYKVLYVFGKQHRESLMVYGKERVENLYWQCYITILYRTMTLNNPDYKKRLKQYLKSTKGLQTDESSWTAFRKEEKKYKRKYPPPSLDEVLDLSSLLNTSADKHTYEGVKLLRTKQGHPPAFGLKSAPGRFFCSSTSLEPIHTY